MAPPTTTSVPVALQTTIGLIDQFLSSLDTTLDAGTTQTELSSHPSPLHLLTASATSLKSSVTKLSLLTITSPFSPTAVISVVQPLNTSILPSLVTATLLTSSKFYPDTFVKETVSLTQATLRDLKVLLGLVKVRSEDGKPKSDVSDAYKKEITEATGKIWEDCDLVLRLAKEEVAGFVVRKAKQWLELMKDAVKELEEWDPEEEDIDDQDWLGLDEVSSDADNDDGPEAEKDKTVTAGVDSDRAIISAGVKEQALKVLSRIPQSVHVVVKQRLEKIPPQSSTGSDEAMQPMPARQRKTLDRVLRKTRKISDCIDESAEAMYMGDLEMCLKKAGEARALTIEVVEAVVEPWQTSGAAGGDAEGKEDLYIKRALMWIQQVEPGGAKSAAK